MIRILFNLPRVAKIVKMVGTLGLEASEEPRSVPGAASSAAGACCILGQTPSLQSFTGSTSSLFVQLRQLQQTSQSPQGDLRGRKEMGFSPQGGRATIEECESSPDSFWVTG